MKEISFLEKIIKKAYKKCIKNKDKTIEMKDHKLFSVDYVTNCDLSTEKYLIAQIKKHYPNDRIVSEEFNTQNDLSGRCWVLDPIDGTVCFSNNIPIWCIQTAFVIDGECKFSIIYCPTINEMYVADEDGLKINGKTVVLEKIKPNNLCIVNFGDFVQKNKEVFALQLKMMQQIGVNCQKVKIFGSAGYEFCMVASGRCQAYVLFGNNAWDILPGSYICEKAGYEIVKGECGGIRITIACSPNLKDMYEQLLKETNDRSKENKYGK